MFAETSWTYWYDLVMVKKLHADNKPRKFKVFKLDLASIYRKLFAWIPECFDRLNLFSTKHSPPRRSMCHWMNILIFTWTKLDESSKLPWTKIVQKSKYNKTKLRYFNWTYPCLSWPVKVAFCWVIVPTIAKLNKMAEHRFGQNCGFAESNN